MGMNLMAGKSPYAMQNVGEAGLATAAAMQAQQKLGVEREAKQSEAQYRRSLGRQAEAYADAIERGAKEKNLELEAEKLVQQRMKDWGASIEGKVAKPDVAAAKEAQIRQTIYQYLGISPTMMQNSAPAMNTAGFKMVGVR
jgi:hypothetical protein